MQTETLDGKLCSRSDTTLGASPFGSILDWEALCLSYWVRTETMCGCDPVIFGLKYSEIVFSKIYFCLAL